MALLNAPPTYTTFKNPFQKLLKTAPVVRIGLTMLCRQIIAVHCDNHTNSQIHSEGEMGSYGGLRQVVLIAETEI